MTADHPAASFARAVARGGAALAVVALLLAGCANVPQRPIVQTVTASSSGCAARPADAADAPDATPEVSRDPPYVLHFLEFDDQGWAYPDAGAGGADAAADPHWRPGLQIDCAISDLAARLAQGGEVSTFVYVHGWHHSAAADDANVAHFRALLREQARVDRGRQVVGFYIGWNGNSLDVPLLRTLTFWGRKNAAHHVAEGSVREFFARFKALRNHWNRPDGTHPGRCGALDATAAGTACPLRSTMIGHSFGAWVLYASISPYLLETLAGTSDLPAGTEALPRVRERGIADLVVLLNPAFEASRYAAVHRAAQRYRPRTWEPPLLVSITSTADQATRTAFPLARFFNSIFQYPATSDAESLAMKHTHGHLDAYVTHDLRLDARHAGIPCVDADGQPSDPEALRAGFFSSATRADDGRLRLKPGWERTWCGGLTLGRRPGSDLDRYSIVWNVQTDGAVIPDHSHFDTPAVVAFITQLHGDLTRAPRRPIARTPDGAAE